MHNITLQETFGIHLCWNWEWSRAYFAYKHSKENMALIQNRISRIVTSILNQCQMRATNNHIYLTSKMTTFCNAVLWHLWLTEWGNRKRSSATRFGDVMPDYSNVVGTSYNKSELSHESIQIISITVEESTKQSFYRCADHALTKKYEVIYLLYINISVQVE